MARNNPVLPGGASVTYAIPGSIWSIWHMMADNTMRLETASRTGSTFRVRESEPVYAGLLTNTSAGVGGSYTSGREHNRLRDRFRD